MYRLTCFPDTMRPFGVVGNICDPSLVSSGSEPVSHVISLTARRQKSAVRGIPIWYSRSPQVLMALPTQGRVLLDTTAGDIDIELWSKVRDATMTCACLYLVQIHCSQEAPKACRNFIALAMEGMHYCLSFACTSDCATL